MDRKSMMFGPRIRLVEMTGDKSRDAAAKVVPIKHMACARCGKPAVQAYRPFCSKRCADLDLGKWLNEEYRFPAEGSAELYDDAFEEE